MMSPQLALEGHTSAREIDTAGAEGQRLPEVAPRLPVASIADAALVERIRGGDGAAFDTLVILYLNAMRQYAASMVESPDDAEDVAQAVFVRLWRYRSSWVVRNSVVAYLMSAVRHEALNRLRHRRSRTQAELVLAQEAAARQAAAAYGANEAAIAQMDFADTIRVLTPRRREAVTLRFQCGMTVPQVAAIMGISPKAAELHLTRAMADLRHLFKRG